MAKRAKAITILKNELRMRGAAVLFLLAVLVVLVMVLSSAGKCKMVSFEGGNLALQYDKRNWKLAYKKEEPIFCLEGEKDYIIFWPREGNDSLLEDFHEELIVEMYWDLENARVSSIRGNGKAGQWEGQEFWYYDYDFDLDYGKERWIIFEKRLENISVLGVACIDRREGGPQEAVLQKKLDEVLGILSSISYSGQMEVKGIRERRDLSYLYEMAMRAELMKVTADEMDIGHDYVPDERTAREIADKCIEEVERDWAIEGWDDYEYEVNIFFANEIDKWIVTYWAVGENGGMLLDGPGKEIRIRRENGKAAYYWRGGVIG